MGNEVNTEAVTIWICLSAFQSDFAITPPQYKEGSDGICLLNLRIMGEKAYEVLSTGLGLSNSSANTATIIVRGRPQCPIPDPLEV